MYRLKVWQSGRWKWGRKFYDSIEAAENRVKELKKVGIRAKIARVEDLYN